MKRSLARFAGIMLAVVGTLFVFTNSFSFHRPETPEELLNK